MTESPAVTTTPAVTELIATDAEVAEWASSPPSWQFGLAKLWSQFAPRGKGWFPRFIGQGVGRGARDVIRTACGARLAIDPRSLDVYCSIARTGGWWEREVTEALLRFVRPGHVVYDIGANVGFMSTAVAARFGGEGVRVYAFEPQPSLARAIAVTAKLNGFAGLHIYPLMLGKASGRGTLFLPAHSIHASAVSRETGAQEISCPVTTLDDLVAAGMLPPPDVIKIDVEGSEWDVFQGARQTLAATRPVIVFESDVNATRFSYSRRQLCDLLREAGPYRFYSIDGDRLTSADERMDDPLVTDMVAVPPENSVA